MGYLKDRETKWEDKAACKGEPVTIFFSKRYLKLAQERFCNECPVRKECLKASKKEKFGVWGGVPKGWLREED